MPPTYRVRYDGDTASITALLRQLPGLQSDTRDDGFWLWGMPLDLNPLGDFREQIGRFSRYANAIIALSDPSLSAIRSTGTIEIQHEDRCDRVVLLEGAKLEVTGGSIKLFARGGGAPPRPISERIPEMFLREPRFEMASNILAECGEDMREIYKVVELIERAHGGFPKKRERLMRAEFCRRIEVDESDWEALHRSARPARHAEPHEDEGRIITPRAARILIQHTLKTWLERSVPI